MKKAPKSLKKVVAAKKSDEGKALGYLQRLNLPGLDLKGQLSLAYSQRGYGLSSSAKIDFGAMLVPFVHLTVGAGLSGAVSAHAILTLHRMQRHVWDKHLTRPEGPALRHAKDLFADGKIVPLPPLAKPAWTAAAPIAVAHLSGKTKEGKGQVALGAWAGLADNFGSDEAGLSIGGKASGGFKLRTTGLNDTEVRHFGHSAQDDNLSNYVDDVMEDNLKSRAAVWLIKVGGGAKEARGLGHVARRAGEVIAEQKERVGYLVDGAETMAGWVDDTVIPDVDNAPIAAGLRTVVRTAASRAKKVYRWARSNTLVTDDLLAELRGAQADFKAWGDFLDPDKPNPEFPEGDHPGAAFAAQILPVARLRQAEATEFIEALERAKERKTGSGQPFPPSPGQSNTRPLCYLNISTAEGWGEASAGAKLQLPTALVTGKAFVRGRVGSKRVSFRYQNFVPGTGVGWTGKTLVTTQDTVIHYNKILFDAEASAKLRTNIRPKDNPKDDNSHGGSKKTHKENMVTMTYRSAIGNWFDDEPGGSATMRHLHPNGSGMSFGLSVMAGRYGAYAAVCREVGRPAPGHKPRSLESSHPEEHKLEQAMKKQLRVSTEELRSFMRRAPSWVGDDDLETKEEGDGKRKGRDGGRFHHPDSDIDEFDESLIDRHASLIVESGFALTSATLVRLDSEGRVPNLLEQVDFKNLAERSGQTELVLQSIRLRYRIAEDQDKSRSLIKLGWNPEPWTEGEGGVSTPFVNKSDAHEKKSWLTRMTGIDPELPNWLKSSALAVQLGLSFDKVKRVGSEGMIDLHTRFYPTPYSTNDYGPKLAQALENRAARMLSEMQVPPVMLMSE